MKENLEQLQQRFPFMSKKGEKFDSFDAKKLEERDKKVLVLIAGVQASGKSTFCNTKLSGFNIIDPDKVWKSCNFEFSLEVNEKFNAYLYELIEKSLVENDVTVFQAGIGVMERATLLERLLEKFDITAILLVLNPPMEKIVKRIKKQRYRLYPLIWKEVKEEYDSLQDQIKNGIIEAGMDEVYIL